MEHQTENLKKITFKKNRKKKFNIFIINRVSNNVLSNVNTHARIHIYPWLFK